MIEGRSSGEADLGGESSSMLIRRTSVSPAGIYLPGKRTGSRFTAERISRPLSPLVGDESSDQMAPLELQEHAQDDGRGRWLEDGLILPFEQLKG